jgi:hypothetical protein
MQKISKIIQDKKIRLNYEYINNNKVYLIKKIFEKS